MDIGNLKVDLLSDGSIRTDGGSFFGVVPKVMWERLMPADDRNRVSLSLNCPLIQVGGKNIIVDLGVGTKSTDKRQHIWHMDVGHLVRELGEHGLQPEDIDYVVFSHLHFDHAGGATHFTATGDLAATFPKAQHLAQRADWDEAMAPNMRSSAGYFEEDIEPLRRNNQLDLLDGDTEILPGVWCKVTGGHTTGHQIVLLDVAGQKACFFGDLIPTAHHLPIAYTQGFDLFPLDVMEQKRTLLEQALKEQWLILFDHDAEQPAGYLERRDDGKLRLRAVDL